MEFPDILPTVRVCHVAMVVTAREDIRIQLDSEIFSLEAGTQIGKIFQCKY